MTIFYFIIGLGLLIFIHELGHFLVAKINGIRVERFSLGFGPHIGFKVGETEYCVSLLPLGGYVKMSGQEDFGEGDIVPLDDPKSFNNKSLWVRLKVVLAGPVMNLLLPFVLMPLVFLVGREEPKFITETPTVLGVQKQSPAELGGLQKDDVILSVNGSTVKTWDGVLKEMSLRKNGPIQLKFSRGSQVYQQELTPKTDEDEKIGFYGFEPIFFVDNEPVIGEFTADSAAKLAGLKEGDRILSIENTPISSWTEMAERVNVSKGAPVNFLVQRGNEQLNIVVTPAYNATHKRYVIGVSKASNPEYYIHRKYPLMESIQKGAEENITLIGMTLKVLKDLVTLKTSYKELGGPIRIAQISAKAAQRGLANFLYLLAFLSIQLGVLNLLPIPILDGGHVLFMAYEGIARKPLSAKKRLIAQQVGMFLLLTLMILVTLNDIQTVWGLGDILQKIKGWFS